MTPSVAVHALGMGEIEVRSALNEPLSAQIKLLSATAGELSALQVALASNEAFSRMGIDPAPALRDLQFKVVTEGAGAPYISIVSTVPIREPFLDLILMANWSNGQLMREYTLLLDPPVFDEGESVAPVMAAKTESAAIERPQEPRSAVRSQEPAAVVPSPAGAPVSGKIPAGSYGPTKRTDTLWSVAREMRPNGSVSIPQMMIGLLKENPEAFADGNVNNLKAGYILRSPSMDVLNSISNSEAVAEANRHYQEWEVASGKSSTNRRQRLATGAGAVPDVTAQVAAAPAISAESGARLKLLSPEDAKKQGGAGSSTKGAGSTTEQLALALETAEATKQENAELRARLTDLEHQLQAVQRLLTLKGDTLGALQAGLGEQETKGGDQQAAAPTTAEMPAGESTVADQTAETTVAEVAAPEANPAEKPAAEIKPVPAAPAVQPEEGIETGLLDEVMANPVLLGATVGTPLLLLLLVMAIRRRRQQAELEEFDGLAASAEQMQDETDTGVPLPSVGAVAKSALAEEDSFGAVASEPVAEYGASSGGMGAIHAEENEIDPIAEADVYLAYRRYEQAEALLKDAIRNDSGRNELKLKLLEIYFTTKDKDAFEAQAEGLYAALGGREDEIWAQAVEMGREISPEHPLFAEASGVQPVAATGAVAAGIGAAVLDSDTTAGDAFNLDHASSASVDEFSFDLSDEELANSLNLPSLEESEIGAGSELDFEDVEGGLESLSSLDETDLSGGGELEELASADEFSLDDDLSATGEGEELDLAGLGNLDADEMVAADDGFNLDDLSAGIDLDELGGSEREELTPAQSSIESSDSDKWTIAPAVSSFDSRDMGSEMDDGHTPVARVATDLVSDHDLDHLSLDETDLDLGGDLEGNIFDGSDDIVGTKLDLARAYIDMGDQSGARSILDEVVKEGDDNHRQEAEQLMRQIS